MVGIIAMITSVYYQNLAEKNVKESFGDLVTRLVSDHQDYRDINIDNISALDGWVEILDEDKNIIYTLGRKRDQMRSYTDSELFKHTNPLDHNYEYYYSITPFLYNNGQHYCLVKIPNNKIEFMPSVINSPLNYFKVALMTLLQAGGLFLILYGLNIFLYSRRNAKKIAKPLTQITEGLVKMKKGKLHTRINFQAEYEYEQIKNAFNYMAETLEKTEKQKVQIEESKNKMLAGLSHDLKTPITTIQGYSKALHEGLINDEEQVKRYLKFIHDKSIRVTALIEDLFMLSKLDNPNYQVNLEELDIGEFVREMIVEHYEQFEEKNMELYIDIPNRKIMYPCDRTLLYRAISNILGNAIKYNPNKTHIYVRIRQKQDMIEIEIGDNGIGILVEVAEYIFEPFVRGDKSRKDDGGTGLGLAISKKMIELQNGKLNLNTKPERGKTLFTITFYL